MGNTIYASVAPAPICYGFFSEKYLTVSKDRRINIWLNSKGQEVHVTEVSFSPTGSRWSDAICVGQVVKWIRHVPSDVFRPDRMLIARTR